MNKVFYLIITVFLGIAMCSCNLLHDASFNPPVVANTWFYTNTYGIVFGGIQEDNKHQPIPAGAEVIIAWENPNTTSGMTLTIFGDTTLSLLGGKPFYKMVIGDSMPLSAVRILSTDTLAIGHLFLALGGTFKNGDTLSYSSLSDGRIIGSLEDEAIVFRRGNPSINGSRGMITLDDMKCHSPSGNYELLRADRFPGDTKIGDVTPDINGPDIQMDDPNDLASHNPFWLQ
jgi:hypothetical protein